LHFRTNHFFNNSCQSHINYPEAKTRSANPEAVIANSLSVSDATYTESTKSSFGKFSWIFGSSIIICGKKFETYFVSSGFLEDLAIHAQRIHRKIKLNLGINDDDVEGIDIAGIQDSKDTTDHFVAEDEL